MKSTAIGRNDPCPCGSGRKFKRCCLAGLGFAPPDRGAAAVLAALEPALANEEFTSLAEAQVFADRHVREQNQRGLDEFHGLSPEQMYRMIYFPFASPELVCFPEVIETASTAPIMTLFALLTEAIGKQGLKATAKGNLPRKFCREAALVYWGDEVYRERTRFHGINREDDFPDLHITRVVAQVAGLIRKYNGKFILSRNCRALLAKQGAAALYPRLLTAYVEQFNWSYRDRYPELRFVQTAFLFTLYLLTLYGDASRPHEFFEDAFLRAFPTMLDEVPQHPIFTPEEEVRRCYTWRTLVHFIGFFGLGMVTPVTDGEYRHAYRVKGLPLLREAAQFRE